MTVTVISYILIS